MQKVLVFLLVLLLALSELGANVPPLQRGPRELVFGNLHWRLKSSLTPVAPGPNYYSGSEHAVWVDDWGLHLTIQKRDDKWWATEIFSRERVGYGTYTFSVETPIHAYEPQVVAGFFTWDTSPEEYNREIDIEFAAWGASDGTKFQYVVQPYTEEDRVHVFAPKLQGNLTTHRIVWMPDGVFFSSYHGEVDPDDGASEHMLIERWSYPESPSEGRARFRINFWLFQGEPLSREMHMVITKFSFVPWRP